MGLVFCCCVADLCSAVTHIAQVACACKFVPKNVQSSQGLWFAEACNVLQSSVGGMSILDWYLSKLNGAFDRNHLSLSMRT